MSTFDVIDAYYAAFNVRDWDGMLALLSDHVRHDINQGETEVGKEHFRAFLQKMDEHYSEHVENLVILLAPQPERAAAEFIINGIYKKSQAGLPPASGQAYRIPVGAFFELANEKITRVTNYYNLPHWIAEVSK